ncbi:MAG: hypothetical protein WCH35_06855 [Comamonadaceae bacterium]
MFLRSFKLFFATLVTVLLSVACGGDAAAPPTNVVVVAGESSVTVSWDMAGGVENWLFFGPTSTVPTSITAMEKWIGQYGGGTVLNVTSPYIVSGLANGVSYSFSLNGRTNGGPGGPGSTPVTATPRIAGSSWSAGTAISGANDLRAVAYGATIATTTTAAVASYVAAGSTGAMYSSHDGAIWSAISYASNINTLNGASYLAGFYTLVGDNGVILRSSDLATWTTPTSNPATGRKLNAIASNYSNLSVAVGASGTIIYSADGVTWTAASNSATTSDLYAVTYTTFNVGTYTAGTWTAVGAGGTLVQSPDAITWTLVPSVTSNDLHGIAYGASISSASVVTPIFVAVGSSGAVLTSNNGISWTAQTLPGTSNLNAVAFGAQFVTVGAGGNIFYSTDGVTWATASTTPTSSSDLLAVTHGLNAYSAVGVAGTNLLAK